MHNIRIEKYHYGQEEKIYSLIKRVYDEFVSADYCEEGNEFFYRWIQASEIAERQHDQINMWVAIEDTEIIGMIEFRENKYVSLLFVDQRYQRQGIARRLFSESLNEIMQRDSGIDRVYVHASPFSIPVYRRMGFVETGNLFEENGIKYMPMEKKLKRN